MFLVGCSILDIPLGCLCCHGHHVVVRGRLGCFGLQPDPVDTLGGIVVGLGRLSSTRAGGVQGVQYEGVLGYISLELS